MCFHVLNPGSSYAPHDTRLKLRPHITPDMFFTMLIYLQFVVVVRYWYTIEDGYQYRYPTGYEYDARFADAMLFDVGPPTLASPSLDALLVTAHRPESAL